MGTRIYIGKLSHHARERDVDRFFRSYGRIRDIQLKNGYGFIEFEDHRDADDAVYELNGKDLCGERIYLEIARGARGRGDGGYRGGGRGGDSGYRRSTVPSWLTKYGAPTRTDNRIVVENLSSRVSWQDLKDYMRQAGEVTYADAHKKHKNEGVVEFASHSDMKTAIDKLDGTEINGRKIKMIYDGPKGRSRSRSRSRSRHSRSRSRSRSRSHSRSRSKSRSRSRNGKRDSRSKSPARKSRSRSRSRSDSRSKSRSPVKSGSAAKNDD